MTSGRSHFVPHLIANKEVPINRGRLFSALLEEVSIIRLLTSEHLTQQLAELLGRWVMSVAESSLTPAKPGWEGLQGLNVLRWPV